MKKFSLGSVLMLTAIVLLVPHFASGQTRILPQSDSGALSAQRDDVQQANVPPPAQQAEDAVERAIERFRIGVEGGISLDPELIQVGAHASFAPIFDPGIEFRPGIELGIGEITTVFGINLDVLYFLPGSTRGIQWMPYIGAGPAFGLSHRSFETDDDDNVDVNVVGVVDTDDRNRFDFSDTDFNGGMNFIAGVRSQSGLFFELKATAWGVSNVRLLAGFNF